MKHKRLPKTVPLPVIVFAMLLIGLSLTWYRHVSDDVPWLPGVTKKIWSIEAKMEFDADGNAVKASVAIPSSQPGFKKIGEHTASPGYGLAFLEKNGGQYAEWSIRQATGRQTLYYQVDMQAEPIAEIDSQSLPPVIDLPTFSEPQATVAQEMLKRAISRSADHLTLARELIYEYNQSAQQAGILEKKAPRTYWLVHLLQAAQVPTRIVHTLFLEDGRRRQNLVEYLQVFKTNNRDYVLIDPETGKQGRQKNQLLWEQVSGPVFEVVGAKNSSMTFSIIEQEVPLTSILESGIIKEKGLLDFSIHSLPVEEQTLFKGILLIPVGVLVVVLLRILVGLKTSGTFMPVLIAIAFIQTSLFTGLLGFLLIVAIGLFFRSYLSQHNLLLVARISAVIIAVILIIALFSVMAFQMGLAEGLKITFFPMIILSWTIERMSILWEEDGAKEVFLQGGGSLFVAIVAYAVMSNEYVRHWTFNFLGLQFVFMALVLLCGKYTGYRLLELRRFKYFTQTNDR